MSRVNRTMVVRDLLAAVACIWLLAGSGHVAAGLGNPVATVSASGVVSWNDCVVGDYGPQPGYNDYAGGDPVNFVDPDGRLVVGAAEGYVFGNWSSDIDSVDRPGRILGRAAGTMLSYLTPGYNVVAGYRDIAAGGFHFGRAIYDISANGLNEENGMALAMSGLELAGGFAGTRMFGAARAGSSEMAVGGGSFRSSRGFGAVGVDDALGLAARKPSVAAAPTPSAPIGGVCFVEGTPVATDDGPRAIETLRVGERVLTTDGDSSTEVDPATWRTVALRMPSPESDEVILDIELLRSQEWIASTACAPGRQIWFELEEMGLRGWAEVVGIEPCPAIEPGQGRVILGTVTHCNSRVMEVRLEGEAEPLRPTAGHRLFSLTRGAWVPTSELRPGELLRTAGGSARVEAVAPLPGAHRVHNLEVETDHCYYVGDARILSHNTNPCAAPRPTQSATLRSEIEEMFGGSSPNHWDSVADAYAGGGRGIRDPRVRDSVARGNLAHQELTEKVDRKPRWVSEPELVGRDGNIYRPDAMTPRGYLIDLKPNTPSGRAEGLVKKRLYEQQLGRKVRIVYYDE